MLNVVCKCKSDKYNEYTEKLKEQVEKIVQFLLIFIV